MTKEIMDKAAERMASAEQQLLSNARCSHPRY